MPSKFLVGKNIINCNNKKIYKGFTFLNNEVYYDEILQLFNGKDFNNKDSIKITSRLNKLLESGLDIDDSLDFIKKEIRYERILFNTIKHNVCYFNEVSMYSKEGIIMAIKCNATAFFYQVNYYLENNEEDYNNNRLSTINTIILNTSRNYFLWKKIKNQSK